MEIVITVAVFLGLGALMGVLLAVSAKLFHVPVNERVSAIRACMPGANCGGCGYSGCDGAAEAIEKGEAPVTACTVGGAEVARQIGEIMGVEVGEVVRMRAQVMCSGTIEAAQKKYVYEGAEDCAQAAAIGGGNKLCPDGCIGLGTCAAHCPFGAIFIRDGVAVVDHEKCMGCGVCVAHCPKGIIKLIPFDSAHWVGCMSRDKGKDVRAYCDVGCIACKLCEKGCEAGAITVGDNVASIDYSKCVDCGNCVEKCPRGIIWSAGRQSNGEFVIKRTKA